MKTTEDFVKQSLLEPTRRLYRAVEKECEELELNIPKSLKMAVLINTLHGLFATIMSKEDNKGIVILYEKICDDLVFERDVLLDITVQLEEEAKL